MVDAIGRTLAPPVPHAPAAAGVGDRRAGQIGARPGTSAACTGAWAGRVVARRDGGALVVAAPAEQPRAWPRPSSCSGASRPRWPVGSAVRPPRRPATALPGGLASSSARPRAGRGASSRRSSDTTTPSCRPTTSRRIPGRSWRTARRPPTSGSTCCRWSRPATSAGSGLLDTVDRLEATLATMRRLERFRGHFYNWYDTTGLRPLEPRYVSTVDSGNLAGHLLALANACRAAIHDPLPHPDLVAGIDDALRLVGEAAAELGGRPPQPDRDRPPARRGARGPGRRAARRRRQPGGRAPARPPTRGVRRHSGGHLARPGDRAARAPASWPGPRRPAPPSPATSATWPRCSPGPTPRTRRPRSRARSPGSSPRRPARPTCPSGAAPRWPSCTAARDAALRAGTDPAAAPIARIDALIESLARSAAAARALAGRLAGRRARRHRALRGHGVRLPLRPDPQDLLDRLPRLGRQPRQQRLRPPGLRGPAGELHRHRQGRRARLALVPPRPPDDPGRARLGPACPGRARCSST